MSLEKLGILFLLNYFNQLGTVKDHILLAVKEILLAVKASIDIMTETTSKTLLGEKARAFEPLLKQIDGMIDFAVERITPADVSDPRISGTDGRRIKEHIVNSIVHAIDDEIENTRETTSERNKLKVQALQTVKDVLKHQKHKPVVAYPSVARAYAARAQAGRASGNTPRRRKSA